MFSIVITERGGAQRQLDLDVPEINIGRLEDNEVVLPKTNVSKRHCRLVLKDDRYVLLDLKSTNGTYVNGRKINAPMVVRPGDKIYIGDFILTLVPSRRAPAVGRGFRERSPTERTASFRPPEPGEPGLGAHPGEGDLPPNPRRRSLPPPPPPDAHRRTAPPPRPLPPPDWDGPLRGSPQSDEPPPPPPVPTSSRTEPPPPPSEPPPRLRTERSPPPEPPPRPRPEQPPPPPEPRARAIRSEPPPRPAPEVASGAPEPTTRPRSERPAPPPPPPAPPPTEALADADEDEENRPTPVPPPTKPERRRPSMPPRVEDPESGQGPATSPAVLAPSVRLQGALHTLMDRLAERMAIDRREEGAFPSEHSHTLDGLIDDLADEGVIGPDLDRRFLLQAAVSEAVGLGPLDRLLTNHAVREVVVDGPSRILADLGGGLSAVSSFFSSSAAVLTIAARLLARAGTKLDPSQPVQQGQLPDGSQVQVLLPPLSLQGPLISVRCPPKRPGSPEGLVTDGVLSMDMLSLLRSAVRQRLNVMVVGPSSSGVSSLLSALASLCLDHERVVTLEESPSLAPAHPQVLPLSRRGARGRELARLMRLAARLRYDRLVIDDVEGEDALSVLMAAAATRGLLLGFHAASTASALEQLEMFAQVELGGARTSLASVLSHALQLIVHVGPDRDGSRRVHSIAEVVDAEGDKLSLSTLFRYEGAFRATDARPSFLG